MRHVRGPGAVRYVADGRGPIVYALTALWCAAAFVVLAWLTLARWAFWPACAGVMSLAISGWALARWTCVLRQPYVLLWTGTGWVLRDAAAAADASSDGLLQRVEVCVDLQRILVLRCIPEGIGTAHWLVLTRAPNVREDWHLLRCALYAEAPEVAAR